MKEVEQVEQAHGGILENPACKRIWFGLVEIEHFLWRDWIISMFYAMYEADVLHEKFDPSFIPSMRDFFVDSLRWWEYQVYRNIRRVRRRGYHFSSVGEEI